MFQSYIIKHNFKKINLLMDQFCQCCDIPERKELNDCQHCRLSHRKGNVSPAYGARVPTEQERLNAWMGVSNDTTKEDK